MPKARNISIVIPLYNAANWVEPTFEHICRAIDATKTMHAEVIIVDDGSSDDSSIIADRLESTTNRVTKKVIKQSNKGRYLARKAGVNRARYDDILFIDSRVFISEGSLAYLEEKLADGTEQVWNGHVYVDKKGNPFARFWDAIVCIAWRKYFANPREVSYGIKDFDSYPKGTGFFFVPKSLLLQAMKVFEHEAKDLKFSSDDTLLIRFMAERTPIHLSPQFSCLYHGRTNMKAFLKHAYNRGQFFVDGFLRPGNRFFVPLLGFLAISVALVVLLVLSPALLVESLFVLCILGVAGLFFGACILGVAFKDAASLALLAPFFAVVYGAGIWRGVFRKVQKSL